MTIEYYESPFHVTEDKETADKKCEVVDALIHFRKKLMESQEELGPEFQKVLNDNICELYEYTK